MEDIIIKPRIEQWFISVIPIFVLMLGFWFGTFFVSFPYIDEFIAVTFSVLFLYLVYSYFDMIVFRKWTVTAKNIKLEYGVFFRHSEFLEIYRIIDFEEHQTFLQMIFRIKTILVLSEDKTTPRLPIFGVNKNYDLISILRPMVKEQRKENRIYEIANR